MKRLCWVPLVLFAAACGATTTSPTAPSSFSSVTTASDPDPNYQGQFAGRFTITSCSATDLLQEAGICGPSSVYEGYQGTNLPYLLTTTQNGNTVSGTITLGSLSSPQWTSTVGSDGTLFISTTLSSGTTAPLARIELTARLTNTGIVGGTINQYWTATGGRGTAQIAGTLTGGE